MTKSYTAVYEKRGKWYIGYVDEIPGVNTQGKTLSEVKKNLKEALKLILEANKQLSQKETKPEKILKEPIYATMS
ncbi:MAG: type II toxin-antitoxin system HicB family antitoxin [Elusimicrobia bacterium]|nr:type II toxin-antitoxin system HicB family antitoxin [Elusimicrobiota bacterium]